MNLLTMNQISKAHTDKVLYKNLDFSLNEGDKVGLIGINGTGKTTLLRIMAGLEEPDQGSVIKGNHVQICYLPQNPVFEPDDVIFDYVTAQNKTPHNEWTLEGDAKSILNRLGFADYSQKINCLSGGQKKRVALAAALLSDCELLILDEPTNHLDSEMTQWLEEYLINRKGAIIMVTHDRYFLDRVSNRIVELDKGMLYSYSANYSGYLELKMQREEMELATERKRQSLLRVELEWLHRGARARSTKQKAHIARIEELKERKEPIQDERVEMSSVKQRIGRTTVELEHIFKSYQEHQPLIRDYSYIFLKQDRVGYVGKNGCGKSTLMKIITQKLQPDQGSVTVGTTIKIGYFPQENEYMDENKRVIDYIKDTAEYIQTAEGTVTATKMLERFLFDSTLQYQVISRLSGGEKRRLYLLKILMESPNVLVLDEPTNDLDIQTLTILEDYLDHYPGIVITVSHDRYFLDRVVTRIFEFCPDGVLKQYEGGYSDYLEVKKEENESEPLRPVTENTAKKQEQDSNKKGKEQERKRRLSYQEQRDYDLIDQEINDLETKIQDIETLIETCATDFIRLNELMNEKTALETQLEEKMNRWVYLQELIEQINGSQ